MLADSILLALFVNWLMLNPVYLMVVNKLPKKPFQCIFCISFWLGLVIAAIHQDYHMVVLAMTAPYLAVVMDRCFKALPVPLS